MRIRAGAAALIAAACGLVACQQLLGLDQQTAPASDVTRTCECVQLEEQGPEFLEACNDSVNDAPDDLLLSAAANGCTNCANVMPCYAQLTGAGDEGDACIGSSDCASWACCQGVLRVQLVLTEGMLVPELTSAGDEVGCCGSCAPCHEALAALKTGAEVVACAEAAELLEPLGSCLVKNRGECPCDIIGNPACLECVFQDLGNQCEAETSACDNDRGRPISEEM